MYKINHKLLLPLVSMVVIIIFSCDNREDIWKTKDGIPEINLFDGENEFELVQNELIDSVKLGKELSFSYNVTSTSDYTIEANFDSTALSLIINEDLRIIEFTPKKEGLNKVYLKVTSMFGNEKIVVMKLVAFKNMLPVAKIKTTQISNLTDYEIKVDASSSFDADVEYGGGIIVYEYEIVGIVKDNISSSIYKQTLSEPGTYRINVRVKDNDGEWSEITSDDIRVN